MSESYFSVNYEKAKRKFINLAVPSARLQQYLLPDLKGLDGEDLSIDLACFGRADATKLLIISSATHGVEGFSGAGVQCGLMSESILANLPADIKVILVHGVNPYGFSHLRRVNEDNIDLNRNFLDFSLPLKATPDYEVLHQHLVPESWHGESYDRAKQGIIDFVKKYGLAAFQAAASGGQYSHPDGLFYGGTAPAWSNVILRKIIAEHASSVTDIAHIDIHTGLGDYGHGELIIAGAVSDLARANRWYENEVTSAASGDSVSANVSGSIEGAFSQLSHNPRLVSVAIEFGTLPGKAVMDALRGDNWLHAKGDMNSPMAKQIKRDIRAAFYCDAADWKIKVWQRSLSCVRRALAGLNHD